MRRLDVIRVLGAAPWSRSPAAARARGREGRAARGLLAAAHRRATTARSVRAEPASALA